VEAGYQVVRYGLTMTRPDLEISPTCRCQTAWSPARPARPVPLVWAAGNEAFQDHWGASEEDGRGELSALDGASNLPAPPVAGGLGRRPGSRMVLNYIEKKRTGIPAASEADREHLRPPAVAAARLARG